MVFTATLAQEGLGYQGLTVLRKQGLDQATKEA